MVGWKSQALAGSMQSPNLHLYACLYLNTLRLTELTDGAQLFDNTATSVAAYQMRNALNKLADTVKDPKQKKVNGHSLEPSVLRFNMIV